jgi:hypothetical protein
MRIRPDAASPESRAVKREKSWAGGWPFAVSLYSELQKAAWRNGESRLGRRGDSFRALASDDGDDSPAKKVTAGFERVDRSARTSLPRRAAGQTGVKLA